MPVRTQSGPLAAFFAALCVGAWSASASAATFRVMNTADSGPGSLRQAILDANASPAEDVIQFNLGTIPSPPVYIGLQSPLPAITGSVMIVGPGASQVVVSRGAGAADFPIFTIAGAPMVEIRGLTITQGRGTNGGAIAAGGGSLTVRSCVLFENSATVMGGAIAVVGSGPATLSVIDSQIYANAAGSAGGGVAVARTGGGTMVTLTTTSVSRNSVTNQTTGLMGGGVYVSSSGGPNQVLVDSCAVNDNALATDGSGGGLLLDAGTSAGTLTLVNSTIAGNNAGVGGAVAWRTAGLLVRSCTFTLNKTMDLPAGGVMADLSGTGLTARNTILSGNLSAGQARDLADAQPVVGNNNLVGVGGSLVNGVNGNLVGVLDAGLVPINDNGGLTPTFALQPWSPALDAGSAADAPAVDQRGRPRPADGDNDGVARADIGAFETQRFLVTTTADAGPGSLRQAILDNNPAGGGFVKFAIPGSGAFRSIALSTPLPVIGRTIFLDAWSQGGNAYSGPPIVEIDGSAVAGIGLDVQAPDCIIRGLGVGGFRTSGGADGVGIKISSRAGLRNWVYGCYIGVGLDGATPKGNQQAGVWIAPSANTNLIGSNGDGVRDAAERNVIAGSTGGALAAGVYIESNSNVVAGNNIGTTASGMAAVPNGRGVWVAAGSSNRIGVNDLNPLNPDGERNLVSGNADAGVAFTSQGANNTIAGNCVGLRADAQTPLPNGTGVLLDNVRRTLVGGVVPIARNVISGNTGDGLLITGTDATFNMVHGNYVGLNDAGTAGVGNGGAGVRVGGGASFTRIGTLVDGSQADAGRRNVISGNAGPGVVLEGVLSTDNRVRGNLIGTTAAGAAAIGNAQGGVRVADSGGNTVGAPGAGANVIAGTQGSAIDVSGTASTQTKIQNNLIGVGPGGESLPGGAAGVTVRDGASFNLVGGLNAGEGNTVRRTTGAGVRVTADNSLANAILGNSIDSSGALGIDLIDDGVTPNAPALASRTGPNNLPNYPVLLSVSPSGLVTFSYAGKALTTYRVELFASPTPDPTGYGEGRRFLAAVNITTDASGLVPLSGLNVALTPGDAWLTATATELSTGQVIIRGVSTPAGGPLGTSEFSLARAANTAPTAVDVVANGLEDADTVVQLQASDPDPGTTLTVTVESIPTGGSLLQFGTLTPITVPGTAVADAQQRVVFRPLANLFGTPYATFTYRASDGSLTSGVATATVNVAPVNDAPSFTASSPPSVPEDAGPQSIPGWATFSPGPPNESSQSALAYLVSNVTVPSLFAAGPSIDASGRLTYTPAPNANGTSQFTVRVQDNGGTANGGVDTSPPQTFAITVRPVNDAPAFTAATPQTVLEDSGPQTVPNWAAFSPGPPNESGQTVLAYLVSNVTNPGLFGAPPSVSTSGTLAYTPAPDAFGTSQFTIRVQDNGGTADGGVDTSPPQTFTITVLPVNDAPSFTASDPPAVLEDAPPVSLPGWATFSPGPANESAQSVLAYLVSNVTSPGLFAVPPAVSTTGTLTYTLAPNASGASQFTVRVQDNGGVANGGVDTSAPRTFTISVSAVNDPPSFTASNPPPVLEDSGQATVANWSVFSPGPADEAGQTALEYQVSNIGTPSLFAVPPAITPAGTLTYTPAPDAFGTSTFTVRVRDSGGTANGGVDLSAPQTFTVTVLPVNDAPSVVASDPPAVLEDSGPAVVPGWASMNPGPANESDQTALGYTVNLVSNAALFSVPPAVATDGTLTYTPAPDASGTAQFSVRVRDSGGTANGGADTSATRTFTIRITPVNDKPTFTASDPPAVLQGSGPVSITNFASGFNPGPPDESTQTVAAYLVDQISNPALFAVPPAVATTGRLTYTPNPGAYGVSTFRLRVRDSGGTANGGVDTSDPKTITVVVRPAAVCRDLTIDARTTCVPLTALPSQLNATPTDAGPGATQSIELSRSLTQPFPIGVTRVTVTARYSDGLVSSCTSTVTVLAGDCNADGVPDSCQTGAGGSIDCNNDGIPDDCQCLWDNGRVDPASAVGTNGQLSHLGGGAPAGFKVADDFYLEPGQVHHVIGFTGQMLTSTISFLRKARLEFYDDCDGVPADQPFKVFTNSTVTATTPAGGGYDLVTYTFNLCTEDFYLEGGRVYWVSLVGLTDNQGTDLSFWATTTPHGDPQSVMGRQPMYRPGVPTGQWNTYAFGPWGPTSNCCVGCVNMAWRLSGDSCKVVWDNGEVDLSPAGRGGSPSIASPIPLKTADNFVAPPCEDLNVCYVDAVIWTNCTPVRGFVEIYDSACSEPTGPVIRSATTSIAIPLNQTVTHQGSVLRGYRLVFPRLNWTLPAGRNYWISAGAQDTGAASARSLFAFTSGHCSNPGCDDIRISPGEFFDPLAAPQAWAPTGRDYVFRIATPAPVVHATTGPSPGGATACRVDIDHDGQAGILDVFEFLRLWFQGCP